MQYTLSTSAVHRLPDADAPGQLSVFPSTLLAAFASIPDPRRRQGTRFALGAILALAVAAILCSHLSVLAIAEWGASQSPDLLAQLGFPDATTPHQSTLQRLLRRLDPTQLSAALTRHFAVTHSAGHRPRGSHGVAIDGKAQRGRLACDPQAGTIHALRAFCHPDPSSRRQGRGRTERGPRPHRPPRLARAGTYRRCPLLPA